MANNKPTVTLKGTAKDVVICRCPACNFDFKINVKFIKRRFADDLEEDNVSCDLKDALIIDGIAWENIKRRMR